MKIDHLFKNPFEIKSQMTANLNTSLVDNIDRN